MTDLRVSVGGLRCTRLELHVPQVGAWFLDADLDDAAELSGKVTTEIGSLSLVGTVAPGYSGTFVEQRRVRIVAGGGGWAVPLKPKGYHNDAGVKARTVIEDAAREAGEQLGDVVPAADRLGSDYLRQAGPGSQVLEDAAGGVPWWVGYDGRTNVGTRAQAAAVAGVYELLAYDPRARTAELALEDLSAVGIGTVLSERLDAPQTVRSLSVIVEPGSVRMRVWSGGDEASRGRLGRAVEAIVRHVIGDKLFGRYRYRVVRMSSDRVELQAVRQGAGLPDAIPVTMSPGAAGLWARLTPGAEVRVEFLEGDRRQPEIVGFTPKGGTGFVAERITIAADAEGDAKNIAFEGSPVKVLLPPATMYGTMNGAPFTGVIVWSSPYTLGNVEAGSTKAGVGT